MENLRKSYPFFPMAGNPPPLRVRGERRTANNTEAKMLAAHLRTLAVLMVAVAAVNLTTAHGGGVAGAAARRYATGNAVYSSADPHVRVAVPNTARYVGTDSWILYGIAHCEQFVYAHAAADGIAKRLYWIQFESYVASMPKLHHLYTSARHASIGGLDFYVDAWTESNGKPNAHAADTASLETYLRSKGYAVPAAIRSGSDEQHVDALLASGGLRLPATTMSVRLVHLADAAKRKELMIIYSEDAGAAGIVPADTHPGARGYARWKRVEAALIRRAEASVAIAR